MNEQAKQIGKLPKRRGKTRIGAITSSFATRLLVIAAASAAVAAPVENGPPRPSLADVQPLATAKLQATTEQPATRTMPSPVQLYSTQTAPDNSLVNYIRSARGEWQITPTVDRDDPWCRLLLLTPKQPLVVDLAAFIDGKPFRAAREAWIDDILAGKKPEAGDTKSAPEAKNEGMKAENAAGEPAAAAVVQDKAPQDEGTETAGDASKQDVPKNADEKMADEKAAVPEMRIVDAQSRRAPGIRERLMTYIATIGPGVSREEIRWLLAEWGSGPPLILLGPGLSWQRSGSTVLLSFVDSDGDGAISKTEIEGLAERLRKADRDVNDVLEISEIRKATERPPGIGYATDHPLVVPLDELTNWNQLAADLRRLYGKSAAMPASDPNNGALKDRLRRPTAKLSGDDVKGLAAESADVCLRVDFSTVEGNSTGISVLSVSPEFSRVKDGVTVIDDVITLDLGADYIEISAAGPPNGGAAEVSLSQVAVGAVVDGDPLLRAIDRDQVGELTSRERQLLVDFVKGLDRDNDGQVSAAEVPIPIRFSVTLGPQVHRELERPTLSPRTVPSRTAPAAPEWFVSADLNKDSDLSRSEFIGTPEMFTEFDTDKDDRLSITEALAAEAGMQPGK